MCELSQRLIANNVSPTGITTRRSTASDRRAAITVLDDLCNADDAYRQTDVETRVAAHASQENRNEVGRRVDAETDHQVEHARERECRPAERRQLDDRRRREERALEKQREADARQPRADRDARIVEPVVPRTFLEHVLESGEEDRHRREMYPVDAAKHREVRRVHADARRSRASSRRCPARR